MDEERGGRERGRVAAPEVRLQTLSDLFFSIKKKKMEFDLGAVSEQSTFKTRITKEERTTTLCNTFQHPLHPGTTMLSPGTKGEQLYLSYGWSI